MYVFSYHSVLLSDKMDYLEKATDLPQVTDKLHQINLYLYFSGFMVFFNTTFDNISVISWRSVLLVEETGTSEESHRPAVSH